LERQAGLNELKLRADLFDDRMAVYQSTVKFLAAIMTHADTADAETEHAFLAGLDRSRFLFRESVHADLEAIRKEYNRYRAIKNTMTSEYARNQTYGRSNLDEESELTLFFYNSLDNLSELFGDELKLGRR
jgi:hypothetical protein